ncbi:MAG: (2Fe-2S)-binding protein [Clostridium sp.]|nr:(2Fe-2S)-binding protein [Clostridium sp.]
MNNNASELVMDNMTKVCICKAISRRKIKEAIREGADSVMKVSQATGSGTGACHGRRCGQKIKDLVDGYKKGEWE